MARILVEGNRKNQNLFFSVNMTMGDLFTAIQNEVSLSEDDVVVEVVTELLRTGRVKYASS